MGAAIIPGGGWAPTGLWGGAGIPAGTICPGICGAGNIADESLDYCKDPTHTHTPTLVKTAAC